MALDLFWRQVEPHLFALALCRCRCKCRCKRRGRLLWHSLAIVSSWEFLSLRLNRLFVEFTFSAFAFAAFSTLLPLSLTSFVFLRAVIPIVLQVTVIEQPRWFGVFKRLRTFNALQAPSAFRTV
jgi:hypothetical protein